MLLSYPILYYWLLGKIIHLESLKLHFYHLNWSKNIIYENNVPAHWTLMHCNYFWLIWEYVFIWYWIIFKCRSILSSGSKSLFLFFLDMIKMENVCICSRLELICSILVWNEFVDLRLYNRRYILDMTIVILKNLLFNENEIKAGRILTFFPTKTIQVWALCLYPVYRKQFEISCIVLNLLERCNWQTIPSKVSFIIKIENCWLILNELRQLFRCYSRLVASLVNFWWQTLLRNILLIRSPGISIGIQCYKYHLVEKPSNKKK